MTCGSGTRTRGRNWLKDNDVQCLTHPQDTPLTESAVCDDIPHKCPVDCIMSSWSSWETCTKSCGGGGQRKRFRQATVQPVGTGAACGATIETDSTCGDSACPVDCVQGEWGSWKPAEGYKDKLVRSRIVSRQPAGGGKACHSNEQQKRFSEICKDKVVYGQWTDCTKTCGSGHRYRYRTHFMCSKQAVLKYHMRFRQGERCNTQTCDVEEGHRWRAPAWRKLKRGS